LVTGLTQPTGETVAPPSAPARVPKKLSRRFVVVYITLGLILAASLGVLAYVTLRPDFNSEPQWSSWQPKQARLPLMAKEIADYVGPTYQFAKGGQLLAIVPSPPAVTVGTQNVSIVAVSTPVKVGASHSVTQQNVTRLEQGETEMYTLCGLGTQCAIASGKPSIARGRLVRRQGLEVALYTFKYIPAIKSVLVYMPPGPQEGPPTVLYFTRESLSGRLDIPLSQTLKPATLANPHRVGKEAPDEAALIDQLTLPNLFASGLVQLPASGALLVLSPLPV
jgi:hypothetical protein